MELEKNKISVIMGIYNCEETLEEAFDSLLCQTYENWVVIMCDDGSSDNTYEIAKKLTELYPSKILLLKNKKNKGLNYTLNKCLENVKTEYVARMDADDLCKSDRFEKEIRFLNHNPKYAFVSSPMVLFDETGEWGCDWGKEYPLPIDLMVSNPFCHAGVMIRTAAFLNVKGYTVDKKLLRVEDLHLWLKLYEKGYLGYNIQEPLYMMRDDRNAYSRRKYKYRINEAYVKWLTLRAFKLNIKYIVYVFRPLIIGLLPQWLYDYLHKTSLKNK